MQFEWDEAKRILNLQKHFLDFRDAITIWNAPIIDPADSRIVVRERRHLALGIVGDSELIIAVVYTFRGNVRRVVSARRARRNERKDYQEVSLVEALEGRTDWHRLKNLTYKDLDAAISADPDTFSSSAAAPGFAATHWQNLAYEYRYLRNRRWRYVKPLRRSELRRIAALN